MVCAPSGGLLMLGFLFTVGGKRWQVWRGLGRLTFQGLQAASGRRGGRLSERRRRGFWCIGCTFKLFNFVLELVQHGGDKLGGVHGGGAPVSV